MSELASLCFAVASGALAFMSSPAFAAAEPGPITVGKVLELFDTIDSDPEAGKLLFAYLSGIGETTGALISISNAEGPSVNCNKDLFLDGDSVRAALLRAGGDEPEKRAATPIIVEDMLARAECK